MSSEGTVPAGNRPANPTQQPPPANVSDQQQSPSAAPTPPTNDEGQPLPVPNETTPPFTEPVPNPPTGPAAERIIEENKESASLRGDDAAADAYEKKLDESKDLSSKGVGAADDKAREGA